MNIDTTSIDKVLEKLKRKDPELFAAAEKKIIQIAMLNKADISHFKNLRGNLKDFKRVHVGSFVLTFQIKEDIIIFEDFDHHDKIYKK